MPHTQTQKDDLAGTLKKLESFLGKLPDSEDGQGFLMAVLHHTQELFGYIPRQAVELISEKLSVPTAHIYGMATFYNFFTLTPKAKHQVVLCKGTACYVSGGARVLERVKRELGIDVDEVTPDGLFGISITRCLGCCGLSPVMQVDTDIYVRMVPEKVPAILEKYRKQPPAPSAARPGTFERAGLR